MLHPEAWVTRGDHVSYPIMEKMTLTMIIINMSIDGSLASPLIYLYNYRSTKAHHIQATQCMGDDKPVSP